MDVQTMRVGRKIAAEFELELEGKKRIASTTYKLYNVDINMNGGLYAHVHYQSNGDARNEGLRN
jgi:hypothetical protein